MESQQNIEKKLIALTKNLLTEGDTARAQREISLDTTLQHHLGLDSLSRAELFRRIEKKWEVELPDRLLAEAETLGDLLVAVHAAMLAPSATEILKNPEAIALRYEKYRPQQIAAFSSAETLVEVLYEHAQKTPDKPYVYLQNEMGREEIMTYGQLLTNGLIVANALQQKGLKPGETVAIMQPTQLGFFYTFFGVLLASAVPVPIYPPLRPQQLESYAKQEAQILHSAEIRFLVTFEQAASLSRLLKNFVPSLKEVVTVDDLLASGKSVLLPVTVTGNDIALIQYTSGSTSTPKGVTLTHYNLLSNIRSFGKAVEISPRDIAVSWLPLYHDFGLIGLVLGTLYFGLPLILLSPITFLSRPERWLWAIHHHRATLSAAPNFAYELCAQKIEPGALEGLDLSSWRLAANGAETIYPKTYERFVARFKPFGFKAEAFLPVYGLAESTVGLTVSPLNRLPRIDTIDRKALEEKNLAIPVSENTAEQLRITSCGKPLPNHAIRIVDDLFQELAERRIGHLQFQGPSSMQGYYNNPQATAAARDGDWWHSGDFAYIAEGEVFITGRKKDIIIKAGHNIYPTVIEELISPIPDIRRGCAVAFGISNVDQGTEKIIIVAETTEKNTKKQEKLRTRITETLIDALDIAPDEIILVPPRTIPKTSSGKLQRSACKTLYLQKKLKSKPVWMQMLKLTLKSFAVKYTHYAADALKFFYTCYIALVVCMILFPAWICIRVLPSRKARVIAKYAASLLCRLSGCRISIQGAENLTQVKSLIFVANHASYIDALVAANIAPANTRLVGKQEIFSKAFFRIMLNKLQYIGIERFDFTKGVQQTKNIENVLLTGNSLFFFPEGTFSYAAGLRAFKLGAFTIAAETNTPICPIAIRGTRRILRGEKRLLRPRKIKIVVGEPIYPTGKDWQQVLQLKNQARAFIRTHCGELSLDFSDG